MIQAALCAACLNIGRLGQMHLLLDAQEHVGHRTLYRAGTRHDLYPVARLVPCMLLQSICVKHVRIIC
jgi:hypothetical protein